MKTIKYILLISLLVASAGCVTKPRVIKSPCVDNQYSDSATPCIRREVNNRWLA